MKTGWLTIFLIAAAIVCQAESLHAESVEVLISGVEGEALANVTAALRLPDALNRKEQPVDRRQLEHFRRRVPEKVAEALQPFGYFDTITTAKLENHKKNSWRLAVAVTLGAPVRITSLRVAVTGPGRNEPELRKKVEAFPLAVGEILRQDLYEKGKGELQAAALENGFLRAHFTKHEIRVESRRNRAEIELVLDTGVRYRFGMTLFHGAPGYPETFLQRHLAFREGETFSHRKLGESQLRLLDSDRFREVVITPLTDLAENGEVPISVQLTPTARRRLRPGLGYGTDTGGRVSLQYRDLNLFERAHLFKVDLLLAERRQSLVGDYVIPSARNLESQIDFRLGYEAEDVETYETRSLFAEAEQIWGLGKGWMGSVYLRLQQEDYIVGPDDDRSRMIIPGVRLSRRRYADPVRPRRGYSFSLEARGAQQALGSDVSLLQVLFSANHLSQLPGRFSLFLRFEGGTTWQDEPLEDIPASLRFFAGGDQSVRGYKYQSLGPKDESGDTIGGKHLAVGSIELERALWDSWGLAVFYDAGNAFNDLGKLELAQGVGGGVRYYSRLGALKVDIARQVGEPDPSWRLHFSVGFGW